MKNRRKQASPKKLAPTLFIFLVALLTYRTSKRLQLEAPCTSSLTKQRTIKSRILNQASSYNSLQEVPIRLTQS
jgi:hypothetical protein